jgi:hypothetical protein
MPESPKEVTAEYARQIAAAVKENGDDTYLVNELLKEFAGKVYRASRQEFAEEVARFMSQTS